MLQLAAGAGAAAFLAACSSTTRSPSPRPSPTVPPPTPSPGPTQLGGSFRMANSVGYIDVDSSGISHPSLDRFTAETGIQVDYQEAIDDNDVVSNEEFFSTELQAALQGGESTGWDLVVLSDWMVQRLIERGWCEQIPPSRHFPANLAGVYRSRSWDPSNRYAAPWQSGMTGIAYDRNKVGQQNDLRALFTGQFAGKVSYAEMRDTIGLAALFQGTDPSKLTQAEFNAANALVKGAVNSGWVHATKDEIEGLRSGTLAVAIASSADIATLLVPEQDPSQNFLWAIPLQGGMLWSDNMVIPKGARNKEQALAFIDWYYDAANAAEVEAWVNGVCPVTGVAEAIKDIDASLATDTSIFPTPEMLGKLHTFVALDQATSDAWTAAFADAVRR